MHFLFLYVPQFREASNASSLNSWDWTMQLRAGIWIWTSCSRPRFFPWDQDKGVLASELPGPSLNTQCLSPWAAVGPKSLYCSQAPRVLTVCLESTLESRSCKSHEWRKILLRTFAVPSSLHDLLCKGYYLLIKWWLTVIKHFFLNFKWNIFPWINSLLRREEKRERKNHIRILNLGAFFSGRVGGAFVPVPWPEDRQKK